MSGEEPTLPDNSEPNLDLDDEAEIQAPKPDYTPPVDRLLRLGKPAMDDEKWDIYYEMGFRKQHVPQLIQMMTDDDLHEASIDDPRVWAPVHAWRALATLGTVEAIPPLLNELWRIEDGDEWLMTEFPEVVTWVGPGAIPPMIDFLDPAKVNGTAPRIAVIQALINLALTDVALKVIIGQLLRAQLLRYNEHYPAINAYLIFGIILITEPEVNEALVKEAVASGRVDIELMKGLMDSMARILPPDPGEDEFDHFSDEAAPTARMALRKADKAKKAKRKQAAKARKANRKK